MESTNWPTLPEKTAVDYGKLAVRVTNVSKKFCRHLRRSMAYGLLDLSRNLIGLKTRNYTLRQGEFWALNDLSFTLHCGESLGVVGLNGSGKTTLLRMLAGIMPPDKGEIMVKGRVGALIAMGTGFHPHLTGRENIYINGSLLGMSRAELETYFNDIIDFAEIGDFIDAPVATYSSGMRVRLAFAIATSFVPAVLLLDEVFAVGDVVFRQRCLERIRQMTRDTAVILVSNRPEFIEMLCSRALWLDKGKIVAEGDVEEVTSLYMEETSRQSVRYAMRSGTSREGNGEIRYTDSLEVYGSRSGPQEIAMRGEDLMIEAPFTCRKPWSEVRFCVELYDLVSGLLLTEADYEVPEVTADGIFRCRFSKLPLVPRSYAVMLKIMHEDTALDVWRYAADVSVRRLLPKLSKKVTKFPHEITVEVGEAAYAYSYEQPKPDEASVGMA